MAKKYLDSNGLLYFWQKIKTVFAQKTEIPTKTSQLTNDSNLVADASYVHTDNNFTTTLKNKLSNVDAGAQVNKIESIKRNGTALTITNKAVDISVPTKTSDITNDSGYITIDDVPEGAAGSTTTPKMDGTAAVGKETAFARGDHVHPSDTSRVPTTRKVNGKALSADVNIYAGDVKLSSSDNTTVATSLGNKVDKVTGKGLSTNDYTDADKEKLAGIISNANTIGAWSLETITVGTENFPVKASLSFYEGQQGKAGEVYSTRKVDALFANAGETFMGLLASKVDTSSIGQASGVCPLDANSKVDAQYLPSYVDDVIEAYARSGATALSADWLSLASGGSALTPEAGKIYVLMADSGDYSANTQFRWSGTTYVKLADGGVSSITNAEIDTILAA